MNNVHFRYNVHLKLKVMKKYRLAFNRDDRLVHIALAWIAFISAWLWWVPIRCVMDGAVFRWANTFGTAVISGTGMGGHFPILVLLSAYFVSMMYLGWRGGRAPFPALLLVWCGVAFAGSLTSAILYPDTYRFRGDTFGIDISLTIVAPMISGAVLLLVLVWLFNKRRQHRAGSSMAWTPRNTRLLLIALSILPLQFVLLRFGAQHGLTDKIGLILTITQWVVVNVALFPWVENEKTEG